MTVLQWDDANTALKVNSAISVILFVSICIYPIIMQLFLYRKRHLLDKTYFRMKFSAAYADLRTDQGRYLFFPPMFLYRRLTIPVCILIFPDNLLVQYNWI